MVYVLTCVLLVGHPALIPSFFETGGLVAPNSISFLESSASDRYFAYLGQ